jgi:hypothetical protein
MCAAYKVWISELTLIHTNIRSVCNSHAQVYRSIWCKTHYDITDNNNNVSSESLYRRYHKYQLVLVIMSVSTFIIIPPLIEWGLYCNHLVRPSVSSHFRNRYLSFYRKKWFYIWYMVLAWWLVPCLPFPGLPHIYFLFTVRLTNEWVGVFLARRSVQHLVAVILYVQWSCNMCVAKTKIKII